MSAALDEWSTAAPAPATSDDVVGLRGRHALVVGGGRGIGAATAQLLGAAGAGVFLGDVDEGNLAAMVQDLRAGGVTVDGHACDVTDEAQAIDLVDRAVAAGGRLDVVIDIVGMADWRPLFEIDAAAWELELQRNLLHHLFVARRAAARMIEAGHGGTIVLLASVSGLYGAPNHGAYGVAKAGVMSLARTMAQEWGSFGIRVNAVSPDMIATPRLRAALADQGADEHELAQGKNPFSRYGEPHEIAGPLVFLASPLSSFMTGQTLVVDGGVSTAFPNLVITPYIPTTES